MSRSHNDVSRCVQQRKMQIRSDQKCIFFRTPSETLAQEFAEYVTLRKASSAAAAAREAAMAAAAKIVEPSAFYPQPTSSPSPIAVPDMSPAPGYRYI